MIDLDELRKLAEAATPGPWEWEEPSDDSYPVGDESLVTTWNEEDGYPKSVVTSWGHDADGVTASAEDRAFIAAAYPQAVLELIERVRVAERQCEVQALGVENTLAERDAAVAAVERVRAIHYPIYPEAAPGVSLCANGECDAKPWPCDTGAALDGAPEPEEKP